MNPEFVEKMKALPFLDVNGSRWYTDHREHGVCFWSEDGCGTNGFGIHIIPTEIRVLFFDGSPEDIVFECSEEGLENVKRTVTTMINEICSELEKNYRDFISDDII